MENKKLIQTVGSVTCVMLLVKALAMVRNILQARLFGAGADVDVVTLANNYTVALFTTVCYALCIAAIPLLTKQKMAGRQDCYRAADLLVSNTVVLSLAGTGLLALAGTTGLAEKVLGITGDLSLFRFCYLTLLPTLPVIALTYLLLALFQTLGHYTLQGSLSLLYNLALCAVMLLMRDRLTLRGFTVASSAFWLLQLVMLLPSVRKERYRFCPRLGLKQPGYWAFLRTGLITMYQASLFLLCYLINTRFATAASAGTAAGFFYAEKLYEPLATALIYSVGIVLFPTFSHKYAQLSPAEYRRYIIRVLKDALLFLLPLSALLAAFGVPIIQVLFEGGDFTMADAMACGEIFTLYALGLGGFFILDLLGKAYYAMGTPLRAVRLTSLALGICGGSNLLFAWFCPAHPALLALGTSLGFLGAGVVAYCRFAWEGDAKLPKKELLLGSGLSLGMGAAAWAFSRVVLAGMHSKVWLILLCCGAGAAGMTCYLLLMGPRLLTYEIFQKRWRRNE